MAVDSIRTLIASIAVFALSACASQPVESPSLPPSWSERIEPFAVVEGLYYVGSAELSSLLITSKQGHILIDVPLESGADLVEANIRKLGFNPEDVKIILTTQAHFDHVAGVALFKKRNRSKLWVSAADASIIESASVRSPDWAVRFPAAKVDARITHLQPVQLGKAKVTAHLTPGHTPGCTSWSGEVEIAGEPKTWLTVCSLSVLPEYVRVGDKPSYPGIARDYCDSWKHLQSATVDIFLSSHGSFMSLPAKRERLAHGDAQAFVDPQGYVDYLKKAGAAIEQRLEEQGAVGGCESVAATAPARG